jgi:hypothetical protein
MAVACLAWQRDEKRTRFDLTRIDHDVGNRNPFRPGGSRVIECLKKIGECQHS